MFFIGRKKMIKIDFPDYQRLVSIIRQGELMKEEFYKIPFRKADFMSDSKGGHSKHAPESSSKSEIHSDMERELQTESIRTTQSQCDKDQITKDQMTSTVVPYTTSENYSSSSINSKSHEENK